MPPVTLTSYEVKKFCDQFVSEKQGDLVDALRHLKEVTEIATQHLLWLYSGKVQSVTR